ncbi:MAG: hypothetical protein GY926_18555 [bacterium]|nr:hypothetical protein [Actinomycetes bacterium]MCP4967218.1 hypothetical protein [bacterium]
MAYPVETSERYWADIDGAFPAERGPEGEPARSDYETLEHPRIVAIFAEGFEQLPQFIVGRADYREHNYLGVLVPIIVVRAQLRTDGVVELLEAIIEGDWSEFS